MDKKVSIVIPVYRAENTIERCVRSVLNGTYPNIELLLVEDCGADRSAEICGQLAREDTRIRVFTNAHNSGVSYTRNVGLAHATGEYLMFLDSDDWAEPDFVRSMVEAMAPGVLPVCGYYNHDEVQNGRMDIYKWDAASGETKLKLAVEELHKLNLLQQIWNKIFDLSALRSQGIQFDESISLGEDTRFVLDYLQKCGLERVASIAVPLYHYMRDQGNGLMCRVGYEGIEELLKNLTRLYEIMGLPPEDAKLRVDREREQQTEVFAYLIMHNAGMPLREKKRLIHNIEGADGRRLYARQQKIWLKERIWNLLHK